MANYKFILRRGTAGVDALYPETLWSLVGGKPSTFTPTAHNHAIDDVEGLTSALAGKLDKRTGIVQSESMTPDTQALFPYALTTASTAIGMEYNILLYAYRKGYTITQSGTGQLVSQNGLFDGKLEPQYSHDGINPLDPFVLLIEGLPNTHSQTGGMIGWTARYWFPRKYKVEVYDNYNSVGWRTLVDQSSVAKPTKDLVIPLYPTYSGAHTKIRITIYEAGGIAGANGFSRWGLSEIFFIHPEAQAVHQYLDVEWAKKLSTSRAIQIGNTSKNFDGSANLSWTVAEIGAHPNTWNPSLLSVYRGYASALDTTFIPGYYYVNSSTTGQPNSSQFGWLHVEVNNNANYDGATNWIRQTFQQTDGKKYYRYKVNASAWSSWYQEYNSQYKPTLTDLGALVDSNSKLLFLNNNRYIRLAYSSISRGYLKHESGLEHEIWTTGNLNPTAIGAMPTSGGTFTDSVGLGLDSALSDSISKSLVFNYKKTGTAFTKSLFANENGALQYGSDMLASLGAVDDRIALLGTPTSKASNYTFALTDRNNFIYSDSISALTFTIPTNASVAFPVGSEIHIMRYGSGELSISPDSGVTLQSEGSKRRINAQYQAVTIKKLDTNTWVLIGAIKV